MARHKAGIVTLSVDGLDEWLDSFLPIAKAESALLLERSADEIAKVASAEWYGPEGVRKVTGKSGDIKRNKAEVSDARVRVFVGSTDTRKDTKSGKPIVFFVHRAKRTSTILKQTDRRGWYAAPTYRRGPIMLGDDVYRPQAGHHVPEGSLRYFVHADNPKAGDGKYLLPELVTKPGKAALKDVAKTLAASVVARAS